MLTSGNPKTFNNIQCLVIFPPQYIVFSPYSLLWIFLSTIPPLFNIPSIFSTLYHDRPKIEYEIIFNDPQIQI